MAAGPGYIANRNNLVDDFIKTALYNKYWIYKPAGKQWYTPEEFQDLYYKGDLHLPDDWLEKYKIMNPQKGVAAAKIMVKELEERRDIFVQRILDYYQKPK